MALLATIVSSFGRHLAAVFRQLPEYLSLFRDGGELAMASNFRRR